MIEIAGEDHAAEPGGAEVGDREPFGEEWTRRQRQPPCQQQLLAQAAGSGSSCWLRALSAAESLEGSVVLALTLHELGCLL